MTKEEILKIIEQNKDILTPENYQSILKNAAILTDEDKEKIVALLSMSRELLTINEKAMIQQNKLYKEAGKRLETIRKKMVSDAKETIHEAEKEE